MSSALSSNSPRFLSAPVHAKIVATELVEVSSLSNACNNVSVPYHALPHIHNNHPEIPVQKSSLPGSQMQKIPYRSSRLRHNSYMPRCILLQISSLLPLHHRSVYKIRDSCLLEFVFVLCIEQFLENVFECMVILLEIVSLLANHRSCFVSNA